MAGGQDWFRDSFRAEYDKQDAALGRFTLAISGKTGVGKSTLINPIFGEEVARTGIGEPVTRGSHLYLDKIGHLGIVDTQGLEVGRDSREILTELGKAMATMRRLPIAGGRPFMTYAKADEFAGQPAYGLREVLDATFRVAPEGVHGALVVAQEIDYDRKAEEARKYVVAAAGSAAGAAAA